MLCVFTVQKVLGKQLIDLRSSMQAAQQDDRPSCVHALRVATRRADAAIFLCQDSLQAGVEPFFARKCRRIRERSNNVRNLDVSLAWLETASDDQGLRKRLQAQRQHALRPLIKSMARWLRNPKLAQFQHCVNQLNRFSTERQVAARLMQLAGQYVNASSQASISDECLHKWRVATKRLRYSLEFLHNCDCAVDLSETLDDLKQLQDRLGEETDARLRSDLAGTNRSDAGRSELKIVSSVWLDDTAKLFNLVVDVANWCVGNASQALH